MQYKSLLKRIGGNAFRGVCWLRKSDLSATPPRTWFLLSLQRLLEHSWIVFPNVKFVTIYSAKCDYIFCQDWKFRVLVCPEASRR